MRETDSSAQNKTDCKEAERIARLLDFEFHNEYEVIYHADHNRSLDISQKN